MDKNTADEQAMTLYVHTLWESAKQGGFIILKRPGGQVLTCRICLKDVGWVSHALQLIARLYVAPRCRDFT